MRYKWISEVQIVEGFNRTSICDLPRNNYQFAPKELKSFIQHVERPDFDTLQDIDENDKSWLDNFIANEYITRVPNNHYEYFSPLDLSWEHPSIIISAVIHEQVSDNIIPILDKLVCKQIVILVENKASIEMILKKHFKETNYQGLEFILDQIDLDDIEINRLKSNYPILHNITKKGKFGGSIQNLITNIELFTESIHFHNYFNRKVYIDKNGDIKNSIETNTIHGNIKELDVNEFISVINSEKFQAIWNAKKDDCDICKDCELRYICIDNRVPYQRPDREWYHKIECNYNPYIAKWKGEDGYRTLSDCGVISNENEFSIDHERIAKINEELWEE